MKKLSEYLNESKQILLWIDDIRNPKTSNWIHRFSPIGANCEVVWVKSYKECTQWIIKNGLPDAVCFDHDLADVGDPENEKTGYDCAKWIADYCMDNNKRYPKYNIQSDNGPGADNIRKYIENYKKYCESQ